MSHKIMVRSLFAGLAWGLILLPSPGRAQTIQLSFPDTTAKKGDTLLLPIRISPLAEQDSVYSGEIVFSYNSGVVSVFDTVKSGTLLGQVSNVLFNATTRKIVFASTQRVDGSGVLVYLKTRVLSNPTSLNTALTFTNAFFNEGKPDTTVTLNGNLRVLLMTVTPKAPPAAMAVGDSLQFSTTGDQQLPLTWSSSDTAVGTISAAGMMRAVAPGQLKIYVRDAQGLQDSTNVFPIYPSQARSLTVSVPNSSHTQTLSFNLPVTISDVTGLGIISGQFALNYNGNTLQALELVSANSMTSSWPLAVPNITSGRIEVALSGTEPLTGSGVLVFVRFRVAASASSTTISFSNVIFNENLNANTTSGQFTALPAPTVVVSPNTAVLTKGDSLQFAVMSGGTPPFQWSSSNATVASIHPSTGKLAALASGSTTVSVVDSFGFVGTSGSILVNDLLVTLSDLGVQTSDSVDVALEVGDLTGLGVLSFESRIVYDSSIVRFLLPVQAGTLSNGLTMTYRDTLDTLRIAASGVDYLMGSGPLIKLRFGAVTSTVGAFSNLKFAKFQFNEGSPTATVRHGRLVIAARDTANIQLNPTVPEPGDPNQRPRWNPAGVYVNVGDSLIILATGSVNDGGGNSAGPDGTGLAGDPNPNFPDWYNSVSHLALVGRLRLSDGTFVPLDDGVDASGSGIYGPGFVGATFRAVMTQAGAVELSINDGDTFNNSGSFDVIAYKIPPVGLTPPPTPVLFNPGDSTSNVFVYVNLLWFHSENATNYRVQLSLNSAFTPVLFDSSGITDSSFVPPMLNATTRYFWKVSAGNAAGTSGFSPAWTFLTIDPPPAPILFTPADSAMNVPRNTTLRWFGSLFTTSYHIQISQAIDFSTTLVDSVGLTDSLFLITNLSANTIYFWHVREINPLRGAGPFSTPWRFTTGTSTSILNAERIPTEFRLLQNYPNPFNPSTTIEYEIPSQRHVVINVYNILGQLVTTLVDGEYEPGFYKLTLRANLPTGMYIYRMRAGEFVQTKRLILLK